MVPIDLLDAGLPQNFPFVKAISAKHNKMKYAYNCNCSIYYVTDFFFKKIILEPYILPVPP